MINNSCTIRLSLAPWDFDYVGWQVRYEEWADYGNRVRGNSSLKFYIDQKNGKIVDKFVK